MRQSNNLLFLTFARIFLMAIIMYLFIVLSLAIFSFIMDKIQRHNIAIANVNQDESDELELIKSMTGGNGSRNQII